LDGSDRASLRSNGASADSSVDTSTSITPNGGMSASHISASGLANTNGPNATTPLHGRDRASARSATDASESSNTPQ
jgi:hypothetical protein